ncbi:hypothetical protein QN277_024378 [Acacia crassicarpa]|uniref:BZIP domain-containing protein n=1 Tax=Acacia crassicarpa TaxID=499986 RepID=A0AAE1MK38_9FABA|nr:hypothetical protein QN277_024378 [Acacia crassicarpa]
MCDDDWVKLAMSDDSLVVDVLLHLQQAPPPTTTTNNNYSSCLHLNWTVRQRRSRSAPRHVGLSANKKDEPTRASPTTPLSWSGATSPSGGGGGGAAADGSEESTRHTKPLKTSRSKVANPSETTTTKRSRRKKTLAELKEEESLLLKERKNLKSELASLRHTLVEHRATNERLKRLKVDWESRQHLKTETALVASDKSMVDLPGLVDMQCHASHSVSPASVPRIVVDNVVPVPPAKDSYKPQEIVKQEASFELPDLNLPVDEHLSPLPTNGLIS